MDNAVKDTHSCTHHMVTSIHTLHYNFMLQMRYLLFNLFAAVNRCRIKIQLLFLCHMINKLPFEHFFFCFIIPCNTFTDILASTKCPCSCYRYCSCYCYYLRILGLYRGTEQSLLQPYTEFLACEHHPDTLTHPIILTFK